MLPTAVYKAPSSIVLPDVTDYAGVTRHAVGSVSQGGVGGLVVFFVFLRADSL
jgi:hypothetical protein